MPASVSLLLRSLHILCVILWVGSLVFAGFLVASGKPEERPMLATSARRVVRLMTNPAMVLAWLSALALLVDGWSTLYARAGWMHGKLTLVLILSGITGVMGGRLRKTASAESNVPSSRPIPFLTTTALVLAALVVVLVVFRFGG